MIDDKDLREALEARAGSGQLRLTERARAVATAHPRSGVGPEARARGWGRGIALAAAGVGMVVVALAAFGVPISTPGPAAGPSASSDATPAGTSSPGSGPTVAPRGPVEPWGSVTWSAGDASLFDERGRNTFVQSAASWRGRWIAVGYRIDLTTKHVSGHIWTSIDGLTWSRDDAWPDVQFDKVVATAERLTIVGAHRAPDVGEAPEVTEASMWTSTDGTTWTETPLPDQSSDYWVVTSAAAGAQGWLVHTVDVDGREQWLAGDPVQGWRDIAVDPVAFEGAQVHDVIGTADGWMAFGMTGVDQSPVENLGPFGDPANDRGAIWSSADGQHWTAAEIERPGTSVIGIVAVANGWIATGTDHRGCPSCVGNANRLFWRSEDGQRWSPINIGQVGEAFAIVRVESDGRRAVVFDHDAMGRLRLRETDDGVEWADIAVFVEPSVPASVILGGGVITVGPDAILTFVDPSIRSEDYFWMVPQIGVSGVPPDGAATQPPEPESSSQDVVCDPANEECGP